MKIVAFDTATNGPWPVNSILVATLASSPRKKLGNFESTVHLREAWDLGCAGVQNLQAPCNSFYRRVVLGAYVQNLQAPCNPQGDLGRSVQPGCGQAAMGQCRFTGIPRRLNFAQKAHLDTVSFLADWRIRLESPCI